MNFLNDISQNTQISNVIKRPVAAELLHVDGRMDRQTDMTKLMVAFGNNANALKDGYRKYVLKIGFPMILHHLLDK